jgi:tRNA threonylcarbamoyladenosine biosynthesis protein TsaE
MLCLQAREHQTISSSVEETLSIGALLGRNLTKGSVVTLNGELGSGKTCLARGIAKGLKVPEGFYLTSPSYSLINEYPGRLALFHVDLYRIQDVSELEELGLEEIMEDDGVTVIEWADKWVGQLPTDRLAVWLSIINDRTRALRLTGYGPQAVKWIGKCAEAFPWH